MTAYPLPPKDVKFLFSELMGISPTDLERKEDEARAKSRQAWVDNYGDTSIYDTREYLYDLFWGYRTRTRQQAIQVWRLLSERDVKPRTILDHGAGTGLATILLSALWPEATVYYQNLPGVQTEFFTDLAYRISKWKGLEHIADQIRVVLTPPPVDLVCSWDVLEHVLDPIGAMVEPLSEATALATSTCFGGYNHYGHWTQFAHNDKFVPGRKMNRIWSDWLEASGWTLVQKRKWWSDTNLYIREVKLA